MSSDDEETCVPGLMNFGSTCFVNALLQALASCSHFCSYVILLEESFHSCRLPRLWRGNFDAPMLWAAKGPLVRALEDCMHRLKPTNIADDDAASALEVLHALVQHKQKPFLQSDQQQDICEALESVMNALDTEVKSWLEIQENPYARRQRDCYNCLVSRAPQYSIEASGQVLQNLPVSGPRLIQSSDSMKLHMRKIASDSPLRGLLAHSLTCTKCGHQFATRMNPFVALMIPIPEVEREGRHLVVPQDVTLEGCLDTYFQKGEQGPISCPKCSLRATVAELWRNKENGTTGHINGWNIKKPVNGQYTPLRYSVDEASCIDSSTSNSWNAVDGVLRELWMTSDDQDMNEESQSSLKGLKTLTNSEVDCERYNECKGGVYFQRSPSFDLQSFENRGLEPCPKKDRLVWNVIQDVVSAMAEDEFNVDSFDGAKKALKEVNAKWVDYQSIVMSKTLIGRLPKVLAISIQRRVFTSLGFEKIYGKLSFPNVIDVKKYLHIGSVQGSKYKLQSVIVHQGDHAGGHYIAARKIQHAGVEEWILASDMRVSRVSERDVMDLEGCFLLYERPALSEHEYAEKESFFFSHD